MYKYLVTVGDKVFEVSCSRWGLMGVALWEVLLNHLKYKRRDIVLATRDDNGINNDQYSIFTVQLTDGNNFEAEVELLIDESN